MKTSKNSFLRSITLKVAAGGISAALYFAAILPTATILALVLPSPLGMIQLRPAIVIPMVIASVFGPLSGFLCGAIGNTLQIFVFGFDMSAIPGFFANGIGAIVTAIIAGYFNRRYDGRKRILGIILAASLGLAWTTGLIIGFGNYAMGLIPSTEIALILVGLVGIGNMIWACTIFAPIEIAVRRAFPQFSAPKKITQKKSNESSSISR